MATQLQIRRGTSTQVAAFTGAEGEIVVNTTNDSVHVNDGSTAGGFEMARADLNNVSDTSLNAALTGNTVSALTITTLTLGATAITATGAELNILDGVTSTAAELNILDGVTATTAELNYVDGVTSAIQTQIDTKAPLASPTFTGTATMGGLEIATSASDIGVDLKLDGNKTSNGAVGSIIFENNGDSVGMIRSNRASANDAADMLFYTQATGGTNTQRMAITSAGDTEFSGRIKNTRGNHQAQLYGSGDNVILRHDSNSSGLLALSRAGSLDVVLDASGNLLVGKTALEYENTAGHIFRNDGLQSSIRSGGNVADFNRLSSNGEIIRLSKDGTTIGNIASEGGDALVIQSGTTSGSGLHFHPTSALIRPARNGATVDGVLNLGASTRRFKELHLSQSVILGSGYNVSWGGQYADGAPTIAGSATSDLIAFYPEGVTSGEAMRIRSDKTVLVGTTSTTLYDATSGGGVMLDPNGPTTIARDDQTALYVNRTSTHGDMVQFRKDGVTHGRLSNTGTYFFIAGGAAGGTHSGIRFINNASTRPCTSSGGNLDDTVTLGASNARWELVYSVGGTTATSDRNEKQDIEELTDAEQRVAVAAKGLLRKYRWKSAVAEKGDDARIHFGIIAQDLQDAFAAEGLDAARYGMWCSDTFWVDSEGETYDTQEEAPEGATEKTRLGVRYAQLLAFIISAI